MEEIEKHVNEEHAEPLYHAGKLVGCVKNAHDIDVNLSAHVMLENIVSKASSVLPCCMLCATPALTQTRLNMSSTAAKRPAAI